MEKITNKDIISVNIEIELESIENLEALGINTGVVSVSVDLNSDVNAKVFNIEQGLGFLDTISMEMIVTFSAGVGSGVVANLIYDALGSGIQKIILNKRRVRPEKEELIKALQTTIDLLNKRENTDI